VTIFQGHSANIRNRIESFIIKISKEFSMKSFDGKGDIMKSGGLFVFMAMLILGGASAAVAQMGMMGGKAPAEIAKMMQEPNKALAQASIEYMSVFTRSLQVQSKERREQINADFVKDAFAEMKRAFEMIEKFQSAHVKTMDSNIQARVQPMMERMNRNLASIGKNLDDLEKEVNNGRDLDRIVFITSEIMKHLDDMPRRPGGRPGMSGMPGMTGEMPGLPK